MELNVKRLSTLFFCSIFLITTACNDDIPKEQSAIYPEKDIQFENQLKTYLSTSYPCQISNIEITDKFVIIKGYTSSDSTPVYLGEVCPYEDVVALDRFKFSVPINESNFTVKLVVFMKKTVLNTTGYYPNGHYLPKEKLKTKLFRPHITQIRFMQHKHLNF